MRIEIYIGSYILDVFEQDAIEIVSSVAKIEDISKASGDYIRDMVVPASENNNIIFVQYYNYDIDNGFDARIKHEGRIDINGITFKRGKFTLQKVAMLSGAPSSYTIGFTSKLVELKDLFKKETFQDLDLSDYDHTYDSDTVKDGLTIGLFSRDIIYTPIVKNQLYINSDSGDNTQTDTLSNISYGGGSNTGLVWNQLRPSIKHQALIDAISDRYGLTFTGEFFATTEFQELYLWLNNDSELLYGGASQIVDFDGGDSTWMNLTTNVGSYECVFTGNIFDIVKFYLRLTVTPETGFESVQYTVRMYKNGVVGYESIHTGTSQTAITLLADESETTVHSVYYEVITNQSFEYTASLLQNELSWDNSITDTETTTASANTIESYFKISENIPNLKIIDYFTALVKMFKLVVINNDDGTTFIDTIDRYYSNGTLRDYTKYLDFSEFTIERGKILNEINFKYQDPQTILNQQFKENNRVSYGDLELYLYEDETQTELLDGDALDVELPFEQVIFERLNDQDGGSQTAFQYGAIIDKELAKVNPAPVIHYAYFTNLTSSNIGFIDDTGTKETLLYSHLPANTYPLINPAFSLVFDSEVNTYDGIVIENTLYKNHYNRTVAELFNVKKRQLKIKGVLPYNEITALQLNDVIKIKENYYRINSFSLNIVTGEVSFDLINSLENYLESYRMSNNEIYAEVEANTKVIGGTNLTGSGITKEDTGDGTTWVTASIVGGSLQLVFDENTSASDRTMYVVLDSGSKETSIYLYQYG